MSEELDFNILDDLSTEFELSEFYIFSLINDLTHELVDDPSRKKEYQYATIINLFSTHLEYDPRSQWRFAFDENDNYIDFFRICCYNWVSLHSGDYTFKNNRRKIICKECRDDFVFEEANVWLEPCDNCGRESYATEKWFRCGAGNLTIICDTCRNLPDLLKEFNDNITYSLSTHPHYDNVLVDITPISGENLDISPEILPHISHSRNQLFIDVLEHPIAYNTSNSLLYWTFITDCDDESPLTFRRDYFAVNCENHEVASVTVSDDEGGWVILDVLYPSFESYQKGYDEWLKTKLPDAEIIKLINSLNDEYRPFHPDTDELAKMSLTFAEYVRHRYNLNRNIR